MQLIFNFTRNIVKYAIKNIMNIKSKNEAMQNYMSELYENSFQDNSSTTTKSPITTTSSTRPATYSPITTTSSTRPATYSPITTTSSTRPATYSPITTTSSTRPATYSPITTTSSTRPATYSPITTTSSTRPATYSPITTTSSTRPATYSPITTTSSTKTTTSLITTTLSTKDTICSNIHPNIKPLCIPSDMNMDNLEIYLVDLNDYDYCFDLSYSTTSVNNSQIDVMYRTDRFSKYQAILIKNINTQGKTEVIGFCISDLLAFDNGDLYLKFEVMTEAMTLKINKDVVKTVQSNQIFRRNSYLTQHPLVRSGIFIPNNADFVFDLMDITMRCDNNYCHFIILISEWIKWQNETQIGDKIYKYKLNQNEMKYKLNSTNLDNFQVRAKVCDEVANCFDVEYLKQTNDGIISFNFTMNEKTEFIRLMFDITYVGHNEHISSNNMNNTATITPELRLTLLSFGDPCLSPSRCSQRGTCDNHNGHTFGVCNCQMGWRGDNCEIIDYCNRNATPNGLTCEQINSTCIENDSGIECKCEHGQYWDRQR